MMVEEILLELRGLCRDYDRISENLQEPSV